MIYDLEQFSTEVSTVQLNVLAHVISYKSYRLAYFTLEKVLS
jgi:hypothetical protein